ncbi:MAG: hypothetical protein U1F68_14435 [Gammaproteobacteria bacterium]
MAMRLHALQRRLETLYGVSVEHSVDDFLITDAALARQLDTSAEAREVEEKLLVREHGDCLDISLYLDSDLLVRLGADDPTAALHEGNLADFCTVLEGVSHFLYLTWNAARGRSVRCVEMEMQAEIDKFIAILVLAAEQRSLAATGRLHAWLFDQPSYDAALSGAELERYRDANRYAGKYCFYLEQRYWRRQPPSALLGELRNFYRLDLQNKIRTIEKTN